MNEKVRESFERLTETARGAPMGDLLRRFWQPVAMSRELAIGKAIPIKILSEELTLYRGASGKPYLVGARCAHRCSQLHTGWIEGEEIRCIYHGWKYDGAGRCVEIPSEGPALCAKIKIPGFPTNEYCGLIFAYLGEGAPPEFDLPRKESFERPDRMIFTKRQTWPCNWFQQTENSMDAVHVSFVHQMGKVGLFGEAITTSIPALNYHETDAGIRQTATRSTNVRISDWTFPNNNHLLIPGITKDHPWMNIGLWVVGVDDAHTCKFQIYSVPKMGPEQDRKTIDHFEKHADYEPGDHHHELIYEAKYPGEMALELVNAQDYVAVVGQGSKTDRMSECLVHSDAGIMLMRNIFWREMKALCAGGALKQWRRLDDGIDLQKQTRQAHG